MTHSIVSEYQMNFDENEEEPITTPDTKNRTRLNPDEGNTPENDPRKWERLSGINSEITDSFGNTDSTIQSRQYRATAFDIVSDHVNLSRNLQREGRELMMEEVDTERLTVPNTSSVHLVAFSLAVCLLNERNERRQYNPQRSYRNNDQAACDAAEKLELNPENILSMMGKIQNELDL